MSDIWHTADEIPDFDKSYVELSRSLQGDLVYSTWGHPNYITPNTIKWCYMDDLLALETENKDLSDKIGKLEIELYRTRKALDVAKDALKYYSDKPGNWLYGEFQGDYDESPGEIADKALDQINNTEQKESEFVHNKIKFPEYNDGLLEEFDKQFFENGQDDDLTETALEQKDVK